MKKVLAFDCGGTNTRLALINEKLKIEKELFTLSPTKSKEKWVKNLIEMIKQFPLENVVGIGIGVPGVVDHKKGVIKVLPNLSIKDIEIVKILKQEFHLPVYLRNDAQVACLGEAYAGAGKKFERVFFVTISTGLGGALCVNTEIQDYVTEVGHTLFKYKNKMIEFETIAGFNIQKFAKMSNAKIESGKDLFLKVKKGDKAAIKVLDEWIACLDKYIKLMNDSYLPDIIVFTGGFMKSKKYFFKKIIKQNKGLRIKECAFKEEAGLIGAGVLALTSTK